MKLRNPSLWIALASTIAVAGFVLGDIGRRPSPGPLADVHGQVEGLHGSRDCSACHGGWGESMSEACVGCHTPIQDQIEQHAGLHGSVEDAHAKECAFCHTDHHGTDFQITNEQSFSAAGVPDVSQFDHRLAGYAMGGRHLELDCEKCHEHVNDAVLVKGDHRFGGLTQECSSCHEDPHGGRMALACADCHGEDDWKRIVSKEHDRFLPLTGGHAKSSCRDCHRKAGLYALETLGRPVRTARRECVDCHENPHQDRFVNGVAEFAAKTFGASCVECHKADHVTFRAADAEVGDVRHESTGFTLDFPHDLAACEDCHDPRAKEFATRYPGRREDDCGRCHADPHGKQFDFGDLEVRACTACHEAGSFTPPTFTAASHQKTAFPLTGRHAKTKCNDCHKQERKERPRKFADTPTRCERCHADAHAGFFDQAMAKESRVRFGPCARCHTTSKFSDVPDQNFDHGRFTGFAVVGAHAQAECESCHPRTAKPDATKRTFGRCADRYGKVTGCTSCHQDVHAGAFDRPELPAEVLGRSGCARCHGEVSFRTFSDPFDHGRWTGYPLVGGHGGLECSQCHAPLAAPDARGRTSAPAKGTACSDCHADPHGGQFLRGDHIDCNRCHRSTAGFSELFFRHNLHSRFRLDATHAKVECASCHPTETVGGKSMVRYRPLGTKCSDCHGAPEDPLRKRKGKQP